MACDSLFALQTKMVSVSNSRLGGGGASLMGALAYALTITREPTMARAAALKPQACEVTVQRPISHTKCTENLNYGCYENNNSVR